MKESATPELLLAPLENLVLKAKTFEMGAPHIILGLALDRPKVEDVANTVLTLKELGALNLTLDEVYSPIDGDLTFLGRVMSNLPIDIRSTRLIMIGYCFGVLEECIIMGRNCIIFLLSSFLSISIFCFFSRWFNFQKYFQNYI